VVAGKKHRFNERSKPPSGKKKKNEKVGLMSNRMQLSQEKKTGKVLNTCEKRKEGRRHYLTIRIKKKSHNAKAI